MNDIKLKYVEHGKYDWNFINGDVEDIKGDQTIINAIKHKLLLRPQELEQVLYQNQGDGAYNEINDDLTPENEKYIAEIIKTLCKEIKGVNDAEIKFETTQTEITITNITIRKDDGGVLKVGI